MNGPLIAGISEWILGLDGGIALAIVFLLPALEASAFLGFIFPGEIAIILGGVLASHGKLALASVIAAAVIGAIVGDTVGYFVGRRWGHRILRGIGRHIPFLKHRIDEHLENARGYIRRRGGIAVFFGRFTAALRVLVPGLAGMAEMPYGTFFVWNAAGGAVWATGFVLLGYAAGEAWKRVAGDASLVGIALLVIIVAGLIGTRFVRGAREREEKLLEALANMPPFAWIRDRFARPSV